MSYNKKIIHAFIFVSMFFLSIIVYLTYFQLFEAEELAKKPENPRLELIEDKVRRGDIISSDGEVLAYSEMTEDGQKRIYPFENMYSLVVGYKSERFGTTLIEAGYNEYLAGVSSSSKLDELKRLFTGEEKRGADLYLTIDHSLQEVAYEALEKWNGSIVALDPKTGATLAMVSKPDFNPDAEYLVENWEEIKKIEGVFTQRALQGKYPPGSVFKIVTAAAAVENNLHNDEFEDKGSEIIGGSIFTNYGGSALGTVDMNEAFAKSSNVIFASLANKIGETKMREISERFMMLKSFKYDKLGDETKDTAVYVHSSGLADPEKSNLPAVGMGQGDLAVTPMNMALVGCAIANDGVIMEPYVVESIESAIGTVYMHEEKVLSEAVSTKTARRVGEMMVECVKQGTGIGAGIKGIQVAGKTGTAQNGQGNKKDHAWFVGYAPANDPQIVVCVMLENAGGTGGAIAAPIARKLFEHMLR